MNILKNLKKITPQDFKNNIKGTSREMLKYALNNGIEAYKVFDNKRVFILKKNSKCVWIDTSMTSRANPVGMKIARNKHSSKELLKKMGYPVAPSKIIHQEEEIDDIVAEIPFPVVVKPLGAAEGKGITVNIKDKQLLRDSFKIALKFDTKVLVEKHIDGDYYRITYVADGSYAATKNMPAFIIGNGKNTARELIEMENKGNTERSRGGRLKKIKISEKTERFLASEGYSLESVLSEDEKLPLCFSGFDGGEYITVTEKVHPYFVEMSKNIAEALGLPIVGIDIISNDIGIPLHENDGVVIEINGTYPDVQFHSKPTQGKPEHLIPNLINYLFS